MIRRCVIGVLLIVGIIGPAQAIVSWRDTDAIVTARHDLTTTLMRAAAAARDIGAAQEAYVAPGQPDQPWFDQTRELLTQLSALLTAIQGHLRASESPALAAEAQRDVQRLAEADARIQAAVLNGLDLSAADLIFTEARNASSAIVAALTAIDRAELQQFEGYRARWAARHWMLLSAGALAWVAAVVLWRQRSDALVNTQATEPKPHDIVAEKSDESAAPATVIEGPVEIAGAGPAVNLNEAANVCVQLSRLAAVDALPGVLGRAAAVLDASGVIVWLGAGEELFAVSGYGYDQKTLARLGPIRRQARNATAKTWRTGQLRTVEGSPDDSGAVAAPMFGLDGCFGVLTAEFRNGRERDPAVTAVTAMFAAQLSTIVPAWPAPSDASNADDANDERPPMAASL